MTVRELRDRLDAAVKGGFGDMEVHYVTEHEELDNLYVEDVGTAIWWNYEIPKGEKDIISIYKVFLLNRHDDDVYNTRALRQVLEETKDEAIPIWREE